MRCVVASDEPRFGVQVRDMLLRQGYQCQVEDVVPLHLATAYVGQVQPELVVFVTRPEPTMAFSVLAETRRFCRARFLMVGPTADAKLILQAMRQGADQYLDETELDAEFRAFAGRLQQEEAPAPTKVGRVMALLSASGGSGTSTLAVNMASVLATDHKKCCLLDLKLQTGDLAALLDLKPTHTLAELCSTGRRVDQSMFERALVAHSSGIHLLAPTNSLSEMRQVTAEGVRQAVVFARNLFPYVVVDLDQYFREEQFQVVRAADVLLMVLRLDFSSLRNAQRALKFLAQSGISMERVKLIANRYGQASEVPYAKAEEALERRIDYYIPEDAATMNRTNNNGVPAVLEYPRAKVSRSISSMAMSLNGQKH